MRVKMNRLCILFIIALVSIGVMGCADENESKDNYNKNQNEWNREKLDDNLVADFKADCIFRPC